MEDKRHDDKTGEYEKFCMLCRRPESQAGKMIEMPGSLCICGDCLQKTIDSMQHMGIPYQNMFGFPMPGLTPEGGGIPGRGGPGNRRKRTAGRGRREPDGRSVSGADAGERADRS